MEKMNNREEAREYFKCLNLSYEDITINDIYKLIQILNFEIASVENISIMIKEPRIKKNKNIIFKNNKLIFAEIRVKGLYFDDREAITFNEDGFIGIAGWADNHNLIPFVNGFKKWCDYLSNKEK